MSKRVLHLQNQRFKI